MIHGLQLHSTASRLTEKMFGGQRLKYVIVESKNGNL